MVFMRLCNLAKNGTYYIQGFVLLLSLWLGFRIYNGLIENLTAYRVQIPDIRLESQHEVIFGEEANLQPGWKA